MNYLLTFVFFLRITHALISVEIHRQALFLWNSSCALLRNISFSNDASMQSCIWECQGDYDCQTTTYDHENKTCMLFSEECTKNSIISDGSTRYSVICFRKDHRE